LQNKIVMWNGRRIKVQSDSEIAGEILGVLKDRKQAGELLAKRLEPLSLVNPLVLAIPRGGIVTGAVIANTLGAELDVIVARKLRSPWNSELAIGAIAEGGISYLTPLGKQLGKENPEYMKREIEEQSKEIARRVSRLRKARPRADLKHRTLILTDDGMATGATFFAVLDVLRAENPLEIIAALPVLPKDKVNSLAKQCDKSIFLMSPENFVAVGQFYETFEAVEFENVESILAENWSHYVAKKSQIN